MTAQQNHVPEVVFFVLYLVATLSIGLIGYGSGIGERRNLLVNVTAALLIASVILLIMDLDRPRRGLIRVSQQTMMDLRASFSKTPYCSAADKK
jgi:hypothetical protein